MQLTTRYASFFVQDSGITYVFDTQGGGLPQLCLHKQQSLAAGFAFYQSDFQQRYAPAAATSANLVHRPFLYQTEATATHFTLGCEEPGHSSYLNNFRSL